METYYDVLGVSEDASTEDIEAAYRERLKETHPDVSDDENASDRTKVLIEAKEVLTDADERARYDRLGHQQYVATEGRPGTATSSTTSESTGDGDTSSDRTTGGTSETRREPSGSRSTADGDSRSRNRTGDATTGTGWSEASQSAWSWTDESTDAGSDSTTSTASDSQRAPRDSWSDSGRRERTGQSAGATATAGEQDADWRAWNTGGAFSVRNDSGLDSGYRIPTGQALVVLCLTFLFYPLLLGSALWQGFPLVVNVVVGACVLVVIAYLQSMPTVGIVVFGSWSLLVPLVFSALSLPLFSPFGLAALGGTVLPLGLSVLTRAVVRL